MTARERIKDTHVIEFNRDAEVQMEGEKRVNMLYRQIESGMMTRNEARSIMNMPRITDEEDGGDSYYHPANWIVAGEEPDVDDPTGMDPSTGQDPAEDPAPEPQEAKATNLLRAMIVTSVTDAIKIERDRVVQRAGMQADKFLTAVDEFYATWTDNTVPALADSASRLCVISHAEESKRLLNDVHSVSTTGSLKSNVRDVVGSWDSRASILIENLMKAVQ
jgi:hypothetical protein